MAEGREDAIADIKKTTIPFSRQHPCCYKAVHCFRTIQKMIGLAELDGLQNTHWRRLTSDPQRVFLAAGSSSSPSSGNLNRSNSSEGTTLM